MPPQRDELRQAIAQAVALQRDRRYAETETLCRGILRVQPHEPTALQLLGTCLLQRGDYEGAERVLSVCMRAQPIPPAAVQAEHGVALHRLGRHAEALAGFARALALQPDDGVVISYQARALAALGRDREALRAYSRAAALLGPQADLMKEQQRLAERVLQTSPTDRQALAARASAFVGQKRWQDAYDGFAALLAQDPSDLEAMTAMAGAGVWLDRPEETLALCDAVLAHRPDDVRLLGNQATAFAQLGAYDKAVAALDAALVLKPYNATLHWNRALYRLVQGQFADAWADFEWRWERSSYLQSLRAFPEEIWDGKTDPAGKTILIHSEQGYGDAIQFARFAPVLAARGARVIIGAHPPLRAVLATIDSVSAVIVNGEEMPEFDLHCPIVSLPARLGITLDSIPSKVPYIRTEAAHMESWSRRLGPQQRPRVGLAWSGNPSHEEDAKRSIQPLLLEPLLALPADFFCLSKDVRIGDPQFMRRLGMRHFGDELTDFAQTAALTTLMDLVISVDTSIAHLAGALARPLWLLIADPPDWRWMTARHDSPWYPTARLFRQQTRGDWAEVIARVEGELATLIDAGRR